MGFRQVKFLLVCCVLAFALGNGDALAQSLLKGATPSSLSVPAGWQLSRVQTFEGSLGSNEFVNQGSAITTEQSHSGAHSIGATISFTTALSWGIEPFSGREAYVSFWEYNEAAMRFNDEHWVWQIKSLGSTFQELIVDWIGSGGFNGTAENMHIISQGQVDDGSSPVQNGTGITVPVGAWHQWEIWYKTSVNGANDAFVKVYLDGTLRWSKGPTNLNGTVDMLNHRLLLGGTYTKLIWRKADGSCGAFMGDGTTPSPTWCMDYSNCTCPPSPGLHKRFLDDVIVLVPSGGSTGSRDNPPGPPAAPFGLTIN